MIILAQLLKNDTIQEDTLFIINYSFLIKLTSLQTQIATPKKHTPPQ